MNWHEVNQHYLSNALDYVAGLLRRASGDKTSVPDTPKAETTTALDALCSILDLTTFERNVLLLCAGIELKADFGGLCAASQGHTNWTYPTFGLALAALPD